MLLVKNVDYPSVAILFIANNNNSIVKTKPSDNVSPQRLAQKVCYAHS